LSLADVAGQEAVVGALTKALAAGKIGHAYLLSGPRGTGKTSVARILAHEVNGFKYELEATHPDIIEIDAASNTGVDNIRELIERAALRPTMGKYKVYIIDEVHMLSKSAFNALLKTLEEPPSSVIFVLATTDPEKVPLTILSRVQHLKFGLAEAKVVAERLREVAKKEGLAITDDALEFLAENSGGSFRDALSLLEQAATVCGSGSAKEIKRAELEQAFGVPNGQSISDLLAAFDRVDEGAILDILDKVCYNGGGNYKSLVEGLARQVLKTPTASTLALIDGLLAALRNPAIDVGLQVRLVFLEQLMPANRLITNPSGTTSVKPVATGEPRLVLGLPPSECPSGSVSEGSAPEEAMEAGELDWEGVKEEIKRSDIGLWAVLAKRQVEIGEGEVKIYAEKPLWAGKLEKAENFAKISRLVAPRKLVVLAEKAPPSETLSKVSAIIGVDAGELKEVEVPDGI